MKSAVARRLTPAVVASLSLVSAWVAPAVAAPARPALVAGAASVAAAVPAAGAPAAVPSGVSALRWSNRTCPADVREIAAELPRGARVDCARMPVPLDRSNPRRGTITLAVTRVRSSTTNASTRTLFVNPGGPGVAADWLAPAVAAQFPALHRSHTIVAVDPRGTGHSSPVDCDVVPSHVAEPRNPDATELRTLQRATAETVRRCAAAHGRVLPHISTRETVADLDAVRAALGASRIDWYGASAGTWLGARYARAYPTRIGRLVLDSTVDITTDWRRSFALQPRGFQRRYTTQFLPWVARHAGRYGLGRTPAQVAARVESLRREAARGRLGTITPGDIDTVIASRLYDDRDFEIMAEDLAILADGATPSRAAAIRRVDREAEQAREGSALTTAEDTVFMAIQCNDFAWSRSASSYVTEGRRLGAVSPLVGWAWITSPCATWPYRSRSIGLLPARSLPTGLVLQNEMDPATPLEGARRVFKAQPRLRAVVVDDEGSHGVLFGRNRCAQKIGLDYLTRGTLPRRDVVCAGTPLPGERTTHAVGTKLSAATLRR